MRVRSSGGTCLPAIFPTAVMPSMEAACASCGMPATMSPMAYRCGSSVSMYGPTCTNPRSILAFVFSRPRFSVFGTRPTAISTCSAVTLLRFAGLSR